MIQLTIGEDKYTGPTGWEDITLEQFIKVSEVEIPSRLRELFIAATNLNEPDKAKLKEAKKAYDEVAKTVTERDIIKNFPAYYGELMGILTTVPKATIDLIDGDLRGEFFDAYFRYIILSMYYTIPVVKEGEDIIPYVPEEMQHFKLDGVTYHLPTSLKMYKNEVHLAREPIVSFAEASEIEIAYRELLDKGVDRMPMFMALYCRPLKESYDEAKVLAREPIMRKVTMDVVWRVFFCIAKLQHNYNRSILDFTRKATRSQLRTLIKQG